MPKMLAAMMFGYILAGLPLWAQHGSGVAGHGGGFVAHGNSGFARPAVPALRSGPALAGRPVFTAAPHFGNFSVGVRAAGRPQTLSALHHRFGDLREDRFRRAYGRGPLIVPYAVSGWIGPGYLDSGLYDQSAAAPPPSNYSGDDQNTVLLPSQQAGQQDGPAAPIFRPAYVRPQPEPDPVQDTALTLIFKDGRPAEQIHNYMLTRTTLYVQEQHLRKIPVDQLDLEATTKANLDSGIDFRLPSTSR